MCRPGEGPGTGEEGTTCKGSKVGKEASSRVREEAAWLRMSEHGGECRR